MNRFARVRGWLRAHPREADALLAGGLFVLCVGTRPTGHHTPAMSLASTVVWVGLACVALPLRRTYPLVVWALALTAGVVAITVAGGPTVAVIPAFVALYTAAARTSRRRALELAGATAAAFIASLAVASVNSFQSPTTYAVLAWSGMAAAVGVAVRSQRSIVAAAEERARHAEQTREEEAQRRVAEERLRIARELHDVVAHHVAVINVQSGVALHLLDTHPDQARAALGHVRESSQVVLAEAATILGLLRTADDSTATQPAPGLGDLERLVASMAKAGLRTTWRTTGAPRDLPPLLDLTAYRILQESLTNAHKHGEGQADLAVTYLPEAVVLEVTNPITPRDAGAAGHGVIGMHERMVAVGGSLEIGPVGSVFRVRAELPTARQESDRALTGVGQ